MVPSLVRGRNAGLPAPPAVLAWTLLSATISLHSSFEFAFSKRETARSVTSSFGFGKPRQCPFSRNHSPTNTILLGQDSEFAEHDDRGGGAVSVTIRRTLSAAAPREARDAWLKYHWEKGGGLPIAVLSENILGTDRDGGDNVQGRNILPILMKERMEYDEASNGSLLELQYTVTEAGPFFSDLIPGSHSAVVTFDATTSGCVMTWNVTFSTTRWASFYEAVTKWTVGIAATTVQEASSTPRLFSARTTIDGPTRTLDPVFARRECLDFIFANGGGLPLLPPIPYGTLLSEGGGSARQHLLRIPPLLTESVVSTSVSDDVAEFTYRLNDPGWLAFPFLVHTHLGRVRFSSAASTLTIDWDVEIRPHRFAAPAVEKLVEMTVSTLLRNVRVLLTQPGAVVDVKQPRGKGASIVTVPKETWIGGVMDAHSADMRPTLEQTTSLFQPWTWGRSGSGDENDIVQFEWTDEHKLTA